MENFFSQIDFLGGKVVLDESERLLHNKNEASHASGDMALLGVTYQNYMISVSLQVGEKAKQTFRVELLEKDELGENKIIERREIELLTELCSLIQKAVYQLVKMASLCPQSFCFHWVESGSYAAAGFHSSLQEGLKKLKRVKQARCDLSFGSCRRKAIYEGKANELPDFYEPCEPYLNQKGLPDLYFMNKENR